MKSLMNYFSIKMNLSSSLKSLSIVIPVFNEEKTIKKVLTAVNNVVIPNVKKEIVVVDDGSRDKTKKAIEEFVKKEKNIKFIAHTKNKGKGAAVITGIKNATGEYIIIQDADLEYDPNDIKRLVSALRVVGKDVVYGTRLKRMPHFNKEERTIRFVMHYAGNKFLSLLTSGLYGKWVTDMETCYKLFPRKEALEIKLNARGFELEPELTAKLLKKKLNLIEIPISTNPRGYEEGKKLNTFRDGFKAVATLVKYRFTS